MAFELDKLSAPISGDAPCGPNLRDDPAFREIEDAPGEFAGQSAGDLRKVVARCVEFLEKTKDQMPAIIAAQASARAGDFAVANDALQLVLNYTTYYWEDFHPGPAEEMAIGRVNELSALARPAALILPLQRVAIARMPAPSSIEFNSAMLNQALQPVAEWTSESEEALGAKIASGAMTTVAAKTMKATHEGARLLRTIMRSIAPAALSADIAASVGSDDTVDTAQASTVATALRGQVVAAAPAFKAMADVLYDLMAAYDGHSVDSPSFGPIIAQLKSIDTAITGFLETFPDPAAVVAPEPAADGGDAGPAAAAGVPSAAGKPRIFVADTPRSRSDVIAAIDGILRFYAEMEPSSPVPLMLRRVSSWVNKDFIALMQEIVPSGVDEATKLLAITTE